MSRNMTARNLQYDVQNPGRGKVEISDQSHDLRPDPLSPRPYLSLGLIERVVD